MVAKYLILLNEKWEWKLKAVLSTNIFIPLDQRVFIKFRVFYSGHFLQISYTYICDGFYTKKLQSFFSHTINCEHISLYVGMELSIWHGNGHVFSCSVLNPVLLWTCFSNMGAKTSVIASRMLSPHPTPPYRSNKTLFWHRYSWNSM